MQDDVNAVDGFIDGFCNGDEVVYGVRAAFVLRSSGRSVLAVVRSHSSTRRVTS